MNQTINNLADLYKSFIGEDTDKSDEFYKARISKIIFKCTDCGCVFHTDEEGVMVSGYAEGSDSECPPHYLPWGFTIDEFNNALTIADDEGCEAWYEANGDTSQ